MIVGVCGQAGSGKDSVADIFVRLYGFTKVALADPIKRFAAEIFDFDQDTLWGPSELRNRPDERYPLYDSEGKKSFLVPRLPLQLIGTEAARNCYPDVWIDYGLKVASQLLNQPPVRRGGFTYDQAEGLRWLDASPRSLFEVPGVVIPDVRFLNEAEAIKKAGGSVLKVERPGAGLSGQAGKHASEVGIEAIPREAFASIINNDGTIEDLKFAVGEAYAEMHRGKK